jgi:hypothetical protein
MMTELNPSRHDGPSGTPPVWYLLLGVIAYVIAVIAGADPLVGLGVLLAAFQPPSGDQGPRPPVQPTLTA